MINDINVLIPDGESGHSLVVARCLANIPGLRMHIMAASPWTALRFSRRRKHYYTDSLDRSTDVLLDKIQKVVNRTGANIILPVDEPAVRIISENLKSLKKIISSVPVPTTESFDIATDKWRLAKFLSEHQIPCPRSILFKNEKDSSRELKDLSFPILIKPTKGHGGQGIRVFDDPHKVIEFLKQNNTNAKTKYVIQSYVDGYDIDCSLLAEKGKILAYTIQKGFLPRSQQYAAPAGICFLHEDKILDIVARTVSSLGFSGTAHVDLRYDRKNSDFKIIEINARYWGSLTGSLLAGVNFPYLACLSGLGIPFELPDYRLNRFIDHTTAAKQFVRQVFGRTDEKVDYKETDFPFIFSDPLAEVVNIVIRRWANP